MLNIISVQHRIGRDLAIGNVQSLSIFYKILSGLVDVALPDGVIPSQILNRGHSRKFTHILPRINAYKFSFFPRVLPLWNSLPPIVVHAQTHEQFQDLLSNSYNITNYNIILIHVRFYNYQ